MKNIVSFSLWGDDPKYWCGAVANIRLVKKLLPGWSCRFYVDQLSPTQLTSTLYGEDSDVEVVPVRSLGAYHGMFWRFWAADDPEVDVMLSRDADSRISVREVSAIKEWLNSDKDFHIIRDHPEHGVLVPGGLWACRRGILRKHGLTSMITDWGTYDRRGIDQDFLGEKVYPLVRETAFVHADFGLDLGNKAHKIPLRRIDYEFCGEVFGADGVREGHWEMIKNLRTHV